MLKNLLNKKRQEGFTIVEVMIVLAIAGLIILVVFLAVPALQRNSRNTQRNNDASLIGAAVNECLNNRNGVVTGSNGCGAIDNITTYLDTGKLRQLTTPPTIATGATGGSTSGAQIRFGVKCADTGDSAIAGNARGAVVLFATEGSGTNVQNRCIEV